jgi:uncharacterized protein (DUF486 family)
MHERAFVLAPLLEIAPDALIPGRGRAARYSLRRRRPGHRPPRLTMQIPVFFQTAGLLLLSNIFMTFAWYGHLKSLNTRAWYIAALISWGIALFEYLLQVPANRIGATQYSLAQLKIMQEAITLTVFVPFAMFYMNQPFKLDYVWAALCLVGAVYFIFRS